MRKEKGFMLLRPKISTDPKKIARAISMCKGVKEVFLTSGRYGFVAIVEVDAFKGIRGMMRIVRKATRLTDASCAVVHYVCRKGVWR